MQGCCERPVEEKAPKQEQKVMEEQDQPRKKQRLEDVLELGSVQLQGMLDWAKMFGGIVDIIKLLEAVVRVQNQCLYQQNLLLNNLVQLKVKKVYGEEFPEGLKGILDVDMEEVVDLVDEQMEAVKARKNVKLDSSRDSSEGDEKEGGEESGSDAKDSEV